MNIQHTEDKMSNFSLPSGKLFQTAAIPDKEISMEPGEYALMLRFPPRGEQDVERFSDDPELYFQMHSFSRQPGFKTF